VYGDDLVPRLSSRSFYEAINDVEAVLSECKIPKVLLLLTNIYKASFKQALQDYTILFRCLMQYQIKMGAGLLALKINTLKVDCNSTELNIGHSSDAPPIHRSESVVSADGSQMVLVPKSNGTSGKVLVRLKV
jgi:hypothetical protein